VSDIEIIGLTILIGGLCCVPLGVLFSLLPTVPGPPLSGSAPLISLAGLHVMGTSAPAWAWLVAAVVALIGAALTVVDLISPVIGKQLGRSSRASLIGAYYGLGIAALLSMQLGAIAGATSLLTVGLGFIAATLLGVALIVAGPLLGGFVGELASMPRRSSVAEVSPATPALGQVMHQAMVAGLAQGGGLLVTTGAKVLFGLGVGLLCVAVGLVLFLL